MKKERLPETEKKVKEFWENQAKEFKSSEFATNPDSNYRAYEIEQIAEYIKDGKTLLDIGCGNGHSTLLFAKRFPKLKIIGVDYSAEMIEYANAALRKNPKLKGRVSFRVGDVLELSNQKDLVGKFDQVLSERCVINLLSWEKQRDAILEMKKMLKKSGEIIFCENTQEGLDRLNVLRKKLKLFAITVRWHNSYLSEKELIPFLNKTFKVKEIKNIGSLYYIISRVVYAKLADLEKKQPEYAHPINAIARELPPIGNFSPNHIFLLGNK
jgi:ubiquinone/menaquinone biosynthesis C-methylase UbiE